MQRRAMLVGLGATMASGIAASTRAAEGSLWLSPLLPEGTRAEAVLRSLPGKKPLIKLTYRPPNYETPIEAFRTAITPNDEFFVRYHLAKIPPIPAEQDWSLQVGGDAARRSISIGMTELRRDFPAVEVTAVCQCSGNRRGLFSPHVPGVEWGYGAMGDAAWRGARLKDILDKAGVASDAVEVWLDGTDGPVLSQTPDFRKSLPLAKAMAEEVIVSYEMNGAPLPHLNGFPVRLIVPGWTATYWMKHLNAITISSKPMTSFWMSTAYRVPAGMFPVELPFASQDNPKTVPITEIVVNSVIAAPLGGSVVPQAGFTVEGVAWDRGHGIKQVEVSLDGGKSWKPATLGADLGHFAFRSFKLESGHLPPGPRMISARATNDAGETQAEKLKFNPAGYHNNVPQMVSVQVA